MDNKLIPVILGVTVGVIMVASLMVPVVLDAVDDSRVYFNNNYTSMAKAVDGDSTTISFDGENYSVNDEIIPISDYVYVSISDRFVILITEGLANINYYSDSFVKANSVSDFVLSIDNKVVTLSYTLGETETTVSFDIGWAYYVDSDGAYRLFKVDQYNTRTIYVNSIDDLVAVNYGIAGVYSFKNDTVEFNGTISGDYHADLTPINDVNDVYQMEISQDPAASDFYFIDGDEDLTVQAFIVPFEVHGYKDGFKGIDSILLAIPLIVILAFVAAFASLLRSRY